MKEKKRKEKTTLLSMVEEKLMVNLSFPFVVDMGRGGRGRMPGGVGGDFFWGGGEGGSWLSSIATFCMPACGFTLKADDTEI